MLSFLYNLSTVPRSGQAAHVAVAPRTVAPCQAAPHGKVGAGFSQPPLPVRSRRPEPPLADRSPRAKRHPTVRSALALASRRSPYGRGVPSRRSPSSRLAPTSSPHPRGEAPARDAARGVKPLEAPGRPGGTTGGGREDAGPEPSARAPRLPAPQDPSCPASRDRSKGAKPGPRPGPPRAGLVERGILCYHA